MFSSQESVPMGFISSSDAGSVQTRLSPSTAQIPHLQSYWLLVSASKGSISCKCCKTLRGKTLKGKTLCSGWEKAITFLLFQCSAKAHFKQPGDRKTKISLILCVFHSPPTPPLQLPSALSKTGTPFAHLFITDHPFMVTPLTLLSALKNHSAATKVTILQQSPRQTALTESLAMSRSREENFST